MRMMIASDLHGSAYYAKRVAELFEKHTPERLILLGDLLYHGPRNPLPKDYAPKEVARILNTMASRILAIRGNCDSEVDQMMLDFPIGADYMIWYAAGRMVLVTHGHLGSDRVPALQPRDILLQGHTHVPRIAKTDGYLHLNPGSTTLPKNGFPHSYMLYENGAFSIRTLDEREMMRLELD